MAKIEMLLGNTLTTDADFTVSSIDKVTVNLVEQKAFFNINPNEEKN